ncbi:MAG: hypothetical protein V2A56_09510 [bacterium]
MRNKIAIFIFTIAVLALLFWWSGRRDNAPSGKMSIGEMQETAVPPVEHTHGSNAGTPTITAAKIAIQGGNGEDLGIVTVNPNQEIEVEGTPYKIRITDFYTHWNWDSGPINLSPEEQNPAVKVEVLKDGKVIYYSWAFQHIKFFRMHTASGGSGEDPRLAFTLVAYDGLSWSQGDADKGEEG